MQKGVNNYSRLKADVIFTVRTKSPDSRFYLFIQCPQPTIFPYNTKKVVPVYNPGSHSSGVDVFVQVSFLVPKMSIGNLFTWDVELITK